MNLLRKLIEVSSMRMSSQFATQNGKTRKQELVDLGLTLLVATLIVIYKVNKAA
jgi:ABC-type phosphate transport system permease subunit